MSTTAVTNVAALLRAAAEQRPDAPALVENRGKRLERTWAQLDGAADAVARSLSGAGLLAGHRVALVMANRIDLVVAYFAILRGGMVAVPINPRSTAREISRMLADSGARVVLCDETAAASVREATAERSGDSAVLVVVDGTKPRKGEASFDDLQRSAPDVEPAAPRDSEAPAVILYTSGTSGKPRGAVLSHRALLANIEQTAAVEPAILSPDDVVLGLLPMFHVYGLNAILGQAVRQTAKVVIVDGFDPDGLLRTIRDEGITHLALAPPVIAAWAGRDDLRTYLGQVTQVLSGASALDPDLAAELTASSGHVVEQGYGLTEAAPVISVTLASQRDAGTDPAPYSVGRPLPGIELRIVEQGGADAADGDPAEVWIRGDNLFSGYWPDGSDGPHDDGWYPTGDIGYLDANGDLTLVDRVRELIIVSGFNVYPAEVEVVIAEVDGVAEVAVVGQSDDDTGECVVAFVVPDGRGPAGDELVAAVHDHTAPRLARFKQPSHVIVVEGLPHSATGKVAKGRLRALARSRDLGLAHG